MKYIARSKAQCAYQVMSRIIGILGLGQGETKIFMTRWDMCDPECDMAIDPKLIFFTFF